MPIEILMPALSPTMTEGNLVKWNKKEGEKVKSGDVIAEIETDKATMEVEAVDEGILGKIVVAEGTESVKVNEIIALLLADGEDASAVANYAAKGGEAPAAAKAEAAPAAAPAAALAPAAAPAANGHASGDRVKASPLAKRIAAQEGVDLGAVQGTGPHGRIIKADVEEAKKSGGAGKSAGDAAFAPVSYGRNPQESVDVPLNNMRKTIAKRLLESKQNVPHFYLTIECEIDALNAARARINAAAEAAVKGTDQKPAYKVSVNDFVIKAVALALRGVPAANASWADTVIKQYNNVDVSVAVALDGGLITPVVKNADQKSLAAISNEMKDLAKRARDGKLKPEEFQGGGFSISNLGMYGIKQFNAIINPPQSCILAIGTGEERVVVKGGQFTAVNMMTVTLSSDHRVVDGAVGAQFLAAFKRYIEDPVMMVV
jgi:pyruvate dehydrogenase E2 component (dihydrolipoamide acetyltransferase)